DYKRTLQLGELNTSKKSFAPIQFDITRSINDWSANKNIGTAADLINASFVSGISNIAEVDEAISFINSSESKSSNTLIELIEKLKIKDNEAPEVQSSLLEIDIETTEEFQALINNQALH